MSAVARPVAERPEHAFLDLPATSAPRRDGPHWPLVLSLLVLGAAVVPAAPLRDAVSGADVAAARLVLPAGYLLFAPIFDVLDALSLLSLRQHAAVAVATVLVATVWGMARPGSARRVLVAAVTVMIAAYAGVTIVPRPMAKLVLADRDLITVDFHSHTSASHDARRGFSAERNRAWHAAAGFDVAYVSDHRSYEGALDGERSNPPTAGAGTILLPALEAVDAGQHVIVVGGGPPRPGKARGDWSDALISAATPPASVPLLILTLPGAARLLPSTVPGQAPAMIAVELSDACPRGLDDADRSRAMLLRLADSLHLALVAGSDNHGWGRTAVAWSVLSLPGWRAMSANQLDDLIRATLRDHRRQAVQVFERRRVETGQSLPALAVTAPAVAWNMLRGLSWPERLSWLAWCCMLTLLRRRRRHSSARRLHLYHPSGYEP